MIYLDPKSDLVFKRLFGDIKHKDITMSFLNSVLERVEGERIVDLIMNDPNNVPETTGAKSTAVDVKCTDQVGNQYIIEMQVVSQDYYAIRAQYYSSLLLGRQLAKRDDFLKVVPVIFVGILNFSLFESPDCVSHHFILDNKTHARELKHLEFHFIELAKFNKKIEDLETILEKWIFFFQNARKLQEVPAALEDTPLEEALDVLAQTNWSKEELEAYDRYLDGIRSYTSDMKLQHSKGKEEGIMQGKIAVAQELLDVLDVTTISKKTGLSIQVIEKLKKG